MKNQLSISEPHHDATGVDIVDIFVSNDGICVCPVCVVSVPSDCMIEHLNWHGERNDRVDRPKVARP